MVSIEKSAPFARIVNYETRYEYQSETYLVIMVMPPLSFASDEGCASSLRGHFIEDKFYSLAESIAAHDNARHNLSIILRSSEFSSLQDNGWVIKTARRLLLGADVEVQPDIPGWAVCQGAEAGRTIALPDWICEVISLEK